MRYDHIREAVFLARPNRFIARILLDGQEQLCHVKNTGRCRELLLPGSAILVQECSNPRRKTAYDLIAVWKGARLINMDAAAPNPVFGEWAAGGGLGFVPELLRPECTHGDSRFDFYLEADGRRAFAEIKGVTLEDEGIVRFPDAPTLRGVKHLRGLIDCVHQGFDAYAVFIIQMSGVRYLEANWHTHREFGLAMQDAAAAGVRLLALDCLVTPESITARQPVEIQLEEQP